jgi:hypothetical protein
MSVNNYQHTLRNIPVERRPGLISFSYDVHSERISMTTAFVKLSRFSVHLCVCELACLLKLSRLQQLPYVLLKILAATTWYFSTLLPPVSNGSAANNCSCPIFTPHYMLLSNIHPHYIFLSNIHPYYMFLSNIHPTLHVPVQYSPRTTCPCPIFTPHYMFLSPHYMFLSNIHPHYMFLTNISQIIRYQRNFTGQEYLYTFLQDFCRPSPRVGCHMVGLKYSQGIL